VYKNSLSYDRYASRVAVKALIRRRRPNMKTIKRSSISSHHYWRARSLDLIQRLNLKFKIFWLPLYLGMNNKQNSQSFGHSYTVTLHIAA